MILAQVKTRIYQSILLVALITITYLSFNLWSKSKTLGELEVKYSFELARSLSYSNTVTTLQDELVTHNESNQRLTYRLNLAKRKLDKRKGENDDLIKKSKNADCYSRTLDPAIDARVYKNTTGNQRAGTLTATIESD